MNTKLKTNYEKACNAYLKAFCDKHEYDYEDASWVGGDVGGIVEIADYFVGMETMRVDIDQDAPSDEFELWYGYSLRMSMFGATTPNYRNWLAGCVRAEAKPRSPS